MSGSRATPNAGKIRLKIKVLINRPDHTDRFFTTNLFISKKDYLHSRIERKLRKKYFNRFPTAYVYIAKIKERV